MALLVAGQRLLAQYPFTGLVLFRLLNAALLQTYSYPDEHWQSLEVAHRSVFGYGYLTWEWQQGVRSILHPWCFAVIYRLVELLRLDSTLLVASIARGWIIHAPMMFQAVLAAFTDMYTYKLARRWFGTSVARWALLLSLTSWCHWFHGPRTLANSMETVFSIIALYLWPWARADGTISLRGLRTALSFAALACLLRATGAVLWLFLGATLLYQARIAQWPGILSRAIFILSFAIGMMLLADHTYYGRWVVVPYEFLHVNVIRGISVFYGGHPWHWYATQGLPALITICLPFTVSGVWYAAPRQRIAAYACLWTMAVYSLLAHKEFRFIYPVIPVALIYAAHAIDRLHHEDWVVPHLRTYKRLLIAAVLVPNLILAGLFGYVHQRGVIDVMDWLRETPTVQSIGYLMPCHSTPYWSRLHRRVPMWFLTCEPPEHVDQLPDYVDEARRFHNDPVLYLTTQLNTTSAFEVPKEPASTELLDEYARLRWWPSHLVLFETLLPTIKTTLIQHNYIECERFFNSFFHDDSQRVGDVIVYCQSTLATRATSQA